MPAPVHKLCRSLTCTVTVVPEEVIESTCNAGFKIVPEEICNPLPDW